MVAEKNRAAKGIGTNQSRRVKGSSSWFNSAKSQADGFKFRFRKTFNPHFFHMLSLPLCLWSQTNWAPSKGCLLRPSHRTQFYIKENENRSQVINNDKIKNPIQRNLWCQSSYKGLEVLIKGKQFDTNYQLQIKPSILRIERERERCSQTV